jgi:hypothetical protein
LPFGYQVAEKPGPESDHPAKGVFDPVALDPADAIAGMAGRARVDRGTTVGIVLSEVRPKPCTEAAPTRCAPDHKKPFA